MARARKWSEIPRDEVFMSSPDGKASATYGELTEVIDDIYRQTRQAPVMMGKQSHTILIPGPLGDVRLTLDKYEPAFGQYTGRRLWSLAGGRIDVHRARRVIAESIILKKLKEL